MEEKATDKQISAIMKAKLHEAPWTLSKKEAWSIMNDRYGGEGVPVIKPGTAEELCPPVKSKEFHLSIEECRARALTEALKAGEMKLRHEYFNWIWKGE